MRLKHLVLKKKKNPLWCGHHIMAHLWRLSLSFILSLFGFILSIGLVFEIVRIIVLVFEIV